MSVLEGDTLATAAALLQQNATVEALLCDELLVAATTRDNSSSGASTERVEAMNFVPGVYLGDTHQQETPYINCRGRSCFRHEVAVPHR